MRRKNSSRVGDLESALQAPGAPDGAAVTIIKSDNLGDLAPARVFAAADQALTAQAS